MLIAGFPTRCNSRLKSNPMSGPGRLRCGAGSYHLLVLRVFVIPVLIRADQVPAEMSEMTPAVEDHPAVKRLSLRSHDQAIVLHPRAGARFSPVKFKRLEFQSVQPKKQVLGPLITIAPFPEAVIDEEIVEDRRAKHSILLS